MEEWIARLCEGQPELPVIEVATGLELLLSCLCREMAMLLGERGAEAVLRRAAKLARSEVPLLGGVEVRGLQVTVTWTSEPVAQERWREVWEARIALCRAVLRTSAALIGEPLAYYLAQRVEPCAVPKETLG